jgi:hypothetical protein
MCVEHPKLELRQLGVEAQRDLRANPFTDVRYGRKPHVP